MLAAPAASAPRAAAQALVPEQTEAITLEEAVRRALAGNFSLVTDSFSRQTAREAVIVADSNFDPVVSLSSQRRRSQQAVVDPEIEFTAAESDTLRNNLSVSKTVETGGSITVATNADRLTSSRATQFNPQFDSDVSITVRQPLLRGGGLKANRAPRRRAQIGVERADETFRSQVLNLVRDTELAFFDLAFAMRNLEVQSAGLDSAERFLDENEARQRAGLATELDIMQARVGVATRRSTIITAEQRLYNATDRMLSLLGYERFEGVLVPRDIAFGPPEPVSVEKSYGIAIEQDPDILAARALLRQLEVDVTLAANQRLPRVDLGGTVGYSGREDELFRSWDLIPERESYVWQVDLAVNIPWGLREGKSRLRTARLNVGQQEALLRELEQDLHVRIRSAVRAINTDAESVEIAQLSAQLSEREYQLEKAKFDAGLSTSRFVVEAQQRAEEARIRHTESQILLKQDAARLRRIEGTSLERYGIDLPAADDERQGAASR